jgi:ATP synthase protein I
MSDDPSKVKQQEKAFAEQVGIKAARKIKAQKNPTPGVWFGLGMMGLVGWSIVVPTFLGTMLGIWLDKHHVGEHQWTLALLMAGLVIGCFNAWHWVEKEQKAMKDEQDDHDE